MRLFGAVLAAIVAGTSLAAPAMAEERGDNFYLAVRGFGGYSDPGDISSTNTGTIQERNTADPAAGGGAAIGYRFGDTPLRLEFELMHRVRVDVDLRDTTNNIGYENNLASTTAMVGLGYEYRTDTRWTPFVAGYAGLARNTSDVERTIIGGASTSFENDSDNLAVAAAIGFDYRLTQVLDLGASYRFSYLGMFETGTMSGGDSIEGDPFTAHDLVISLQFNF